MGDPVHSAFGAYLTRLREDRGLALRRVCELSASGATPVDKATLSRCEHGQQGATLSVLVALSRVYGVPADALIERFELDAELGLIGAPDTGGKDYAALRDAGRRALLQASLKWQAYGYYRVA